MPTGEGLRTSQWGAFPWWEQGCEISRLLSWRINVCVCWLRTLADTYLRALCEELEKLDLCPGSLTFTQGPPWPWCHHNPPQTPHFIVLIARGLEVAELRSLTEFCGLRVSVETYVAPKNQAVQALSTLRSYAALLPFGTPVCCFWWGSSLRGVLDFTAAF